MTIHVLLTSDNHLDPQLGGYGSRLGERKRDFQRCFETVVNFALENRPDLLLLGGDLYDNLLPSNLTRAFVSDQFKLLNEKGTKILIVGGRHDTPLNSENEASPLAVHAKSGLVYLFSEDAPISKRIEVNGTPVSVTGLSLNYTLREDEDPLARRSIRRDGDVNILLTHYPVNGFESYSASETHIDENSIPANYQLFASGRLHKYQKRVINGTPVMYPGSTERTSFQEENETKGFVWLEIDKSGVVHDEFVRTGARPMETLDFMASSEGSLSQQIRDALIERPGDEKIVRVRVSGRVTLGQLGAYTRSELTNFARERFFHVEFDEDNLSVLSDASPEYSRRTTPLQELDNIFKDLMKTADEDKRPLVQEAWKLTATKLQKEGFA